MNEKWKSRDNNYKLYFQEGCLLSTMFYTRFCAQRKRAKVKIKKKIHIWLKFYFSTIVALLQKSFHRQEKEKGSWREKMEPNI